MEAIKTYKGFNKDMTCRGFQYEEGKEYNTEKAEACVCGFHASEYPLDVFSYYPPGTSVYHKVEQSGEFDRSESDKVASTKIKIGARIDIAGVVKAAISYIKERITNENNAEPGKAATAGSYGAATAGSYGSTPYLLTIQLRLIILKEAVASRVMFILNRSHAIVPRQRNF